MTMAATATASTRRRRASPSSAAAALHVALLGLLAPPAVPAASAASAMAQIPRPPSASALALTLTAAAWLRPAAAGRDAASDIERASCGASLEDADFATVATDGSRMRTVEWKERRDMAAEGDACLHLDGALKTCASHSSVIDEHLVHFPAAHLNRGYVSGVRRVLFVGRGDGTVLGEILKYDDLEIVVGLEPDQAAIRSSFEHLRARPHFDDPRVQWWFGDVSSSLSLLPREYFGTFDLVLSGLTEDETEAIAVGGLDFVEVARRLLAPWGILASGGPGRFEVLSQRFDTCLRLRIPNVAYVCDYEVTICASDKNVDFLDPSFVHLRGVRDGEVDSLVYRPQNDIDLHWNLITDFSKYWGEPMQCQAKDPSAHAESVAQAGILMVVEAEDVTIELSDVEDLADKFDEILKSLDFNVMEVTKGPAGKEGGVSFLLALEEGYVLAETWPDANYCKLDLHLWSHFGRQEDLRSELLKALGSGHGSWQSYRVVTGGMSSCFSSEMDLTTTGPDLTGAGQCEPDEEGEGRTVVHNATIDDEAALGPTIDAALTNTITMVTRGRMSSLGAVVFCGPKGRPCRAGSALEQLGFSNLVKLWSCSAEEEGRMDVNMGQRDKALDANGEGADDGILSELSLCGKEAKAVLEDITNSTGCPSIVVVDALAPSSHVAGSHRFWLHRRDVQAKPSLLLVPILDVSDAERTSFLMSRFDASVEEDPQFYSEMLVGGGDKVMSFGLIHEGNADSLHGLMRARDRMVHGDDVSFADIRRVTVQGAARKQANYDPVLFSWDDRDSRPALEQFYGQRHVGLQTNWWFRSDSGGALSALQVEEELKAVIGLMWEGAEDAMKFIPTVCEGLFVVILSSDGQMVITWDGAAIANANVFSYAGGINPYLGLVVLLEKFLGMEPIQIDDHPRGHGKVVTKSGRVTFDDGPDCHDHYKLCKELPCTDSEGAAAWMSNHCRLSCDHCESSIKSEL
ncbi:hypothetical protein ACHAWF_014480 [Thalassiosira exigua]